ncbi:cell wall-associated NlpC family hydrolase [Flavobacterium sp. 28A]|uniref:C40 family peptidase n=1 Tax=Flavobacterium sp. 28A TaxID=2735895 RepID=UPI00156E3E37|nr:C40 family peptidase [Flavobacterium sp. 28A]NRT13684.1 cell wall-associated NlpC family hydrolase [Flavobacterium sp. 28A]
MKYTSWILGMVFLSGFSAFSQEKYTEHTVAKGETISKIAQQYKVKSSAIYALNPESRKGIKYKGILLIPIKAGKSKSTVATVSNTKIHTAYPKETLYSIAKKYSITVDELYAVNPSLKKSGLKNGQKIQIPVTTSNTALISNEKTQQAPELVSVENSVPQEITPTHNTTGTIVREILPNETKYAIAKEYGISVADIDSANPILETEALKIGQKIIIPIKDDNSSNVLAIAKVTPKIETVTAIAETTITREVLPKETKYGIAKEYGITVKELENQNPNIVNGLPVGYKLNITSKNEIASTISNEAIVANDSKEHEGSKGFKSTKDDDFLDQLVSTASENLGTRYRYGGTTKNGIDCSALMCNTFSAFDIQLPRTSIEQSQYGVVVNNEEAKKGDLIFFKTSRRNRINHVGMVVDVNDGDIKFIHASVSEGVIISSVKEKYYSKRVTQINRVL